MTVPHTLAKPSAFVQPYLFFGGRCEEALDFYQSALGAQIETILRHKDSPAPPPPGTVQPGFEDKIMHSSFRVGETVLMACDGCEEGSTAGSPWLSLSVPTVSDAEHAFSKLSDGGHVQMPLGETFWSPRFGMVKDRFGVGWLVMAQAVQ